MCFFVLGEINTGHFSRGTCLHCRTSIRPFQSGHIDKKSPVGAVQLKMWLSSTLCGRAFPAGQQAQGQHLDSV